MRPAARQTSIASFLLCALLCAWLGHDIQQHHSHHDGPSHHQHQSEGEASHTKAVPRGQTCHASQLVVVALLVSFCSFMPEQTVMVAEAPAFEARPLFESQFWARPHSPRAPPARLLLS